MNHNIQTVSFIPESDDQPFTMIVTASTGGQIVLQGENVIGLYFHLTELLVPDSDDDVTEETLH